MPGHDVAVAGAERSCPDDEVGDRQGEDLRPDHPHALETAEKAHKDRDQVDPRSEERREDEQEREDRDGHRHVEEAHDGFVDQAAVVPRHDAGGGADGDRDGGSDETEEQRRPRAPYEPAEDVLGEVVRPEQVVFVGGGERRARDRVRVVGRDHRGQEGDRAVREDDAEACGKDDLLPRHRHPPARADRRGGRSGRRRCSPR
ncbi:MAG: hypothetical protein BWX50_00292 [Euryarchaeota archaeon ADurb.Bin009]|nr:MAG: hypothetical protein BWX50_00292 [Euryarchaeota archaeon ADurb.Bin009]